MGCCDSEGGVCLQAVCVTTAAGVLATCGLLGVGCMPTCWLHAHPGGCSRHMTAHALCSRYQGHAISYIHLKEFGSRLDRCLPVMLVSCCALVTAVDGVSLLLGI